jgi:PAB-dependent poly(A)-specific ribonuclease subunit 2
VPYEPVVMRGPGARGLVAVGTADGQLSLLDPRAGYKVEATVAAHSGGFAALDVRGESLATAGFAVRHGQLAVDTYVKARPVRPPSCLSSMGCQHAYPLPCGSV